MTGTPAAAAPSGLVTVAFPNAGDFGAWHDAQCAARGVPFPGRDAAGYPAILAQWTTAVADPWEIDGYVCVTLTADEYANDPTLKGLEVVTVKYPSAPGSDVDANGDPISEITVPAFEWHQQVPPQWTDPDDGVTYDTATGEPVA
jgi:hypothetical protein